MSVDLTWFFGRFFHLEKMRLHCRALFWGWPQHLTSVKVVGRVSKEDLVVRKERKKSTWPQFSQVMGWLHCPIRVRHLKFKWQEGKLHKNAGMFRSCLFTCEVHIEFRVRSWDSKTRSTGNCWRKEKKETKSGMKSWPFSWAWIGKRGKKWARKLDQRLERFTILRAKLGCDALFTLISGHFQFMVKMSCRWRKESMGIVDENGLKNGLTRENVLWVVRAQISLLQVACHRAHVCKSSWWTMDRKSWPSQVKSKVRRGKKKELYDLISHNNKELLHGFVVPKVRKKNWELDQKSLDLFVSRRKSPKNYHAFWELTLLEHGFTKCKTWYDAVYILRHW